MPGREGAERCNFIKTRYSISDLSSITKSSDSVQFERHPSSIFTSLLNRPRCKTMSGESGTNTVQGMELEDTMIPKNSLLPALPGASELLFGSTTMEKKLYFDRSHYTTTEGQIQALASSSTLYLGNLAFSTRSIHIQSHFSQIGPVKMVVLGVNRTTKMPCGFAFVEYYDRRHALQAVANLSGTKLDGNVIRVELDAGFKESRQYGRGRAGGQVRDDRRPTRRDNAALPNYYGNQGSNALQGEKHEQEEDPQMASNIEKNPRFRED